MPRLHSPDPARDLGAEADLLRSGSRYHAHPRGCEHAAATLHFHRLRHGNGHLQWIKLRAIEARAHNNPKAASLENIASPEMLEQEAYRSRSVSLGLHIRLSVLRLRHRQGYASCHCCRGRNRTWRECMTCKVFAAHKILGPSKSTVTNPVAQYKAL